MEQGHRVMIAACDTFRSGAVEQLRVHVQRLNYIHPPEQHHGVQMVQLYEKGYGSDAAAVANYAISAGSIPANVRAYLPVSHWCSA